ncbi:MAG TPA: FAD-dependent oxidoreductase [Opitutaceae bacterium]|jgi:sulfide:quinone oxidoreductase
MKTRILVLGAGFGGLELTTLLTESLGDSVDITLIDKSDSFTFGYSKLDVMFRGTPVESVGLPYRNFVKPGVRFCQETILSVDPAAKRVATSAGIYEAEHLVIALGADYDIAATPGLADASEFYTVPGAARIGQLLQSFPGGHVVIGLCGAPYKCPPAPCEAAFMLHDFLTERGLRQKSKITLISPFDIPIPPSPETSQAILAAFAERDIGFLAEREVQSIDAVRKIATTDDGQQHGYDLFLGVPKHRAPKILAEAGLTEGGWVAVNKYTLQTRFPDVYAIGDCAKQGTPKAGLFAEGAARAVASALVAKLRVGATGAPHEGKGSCYLEFGGGLIGRVDVDFFSNPDGPTGSYFPPSLEMRANKEHFGATRRARWFGL